MAEVDILGMISFLKGKIEHISGKYIMLDVSGVGYKIYAAKSVLDSLAGNDADIKVFTYLVVRQDAMELYGFKTKEELDFFEILIGVSGVGPKIAMLILSESEMPKIKKAILAGKYELLLMPGVGKKTAQKIIIELQSKIDKAGLEDVDLRNFKAEEEVVDALMSLGYKKREIEEVIKVMPPELKTSKEKVKYALGALGGKK
jgi:Holliday junction DNA helicase RuvA